MNHSFDIEHAREYGLEEAIMIHHFWYWIRHNRGHEKHFHDGRTWSYNTLAAFGDDFPYWSSRQIRRALDSLVRQGVLLKGRYGQQEGWSSFNRTLWYAFADEERFLPPWIARDDDQCNSRNGQMQELETSDEQDRTVSPTGPNGSVDVTERANESKEQLGTHVSTTLSSKQATRVPARGDADCLPATKPKAPDSDPTGGVRTTHAREQPSEGAALLMKPVSLGGAGIDDRARAEELAALRPLEELEARVRAALAREDIRNKAGFIIHQIRTNAPPPQRYVNGVSQELKQRSAAMDMNEALSRQIWTGHPR